MAHEPKGSLSREAIREGFPWVDREGQDMIIGSDIDAVMSAAYLSEYLDWTPIGFYTDFENLYTVPGASGADVRDAVWVDLDIYHPSIASIGHHILNFRLSDEVPGHAESLNPNLRRGMYHGNFSRKYPLGTIHFLTWLQGQPTTATEPQQLLYWVPDSTWINGQSHRFRENVRDWLYNCIPIDFLTDSFKWIDEADFEEALQAEIYPRIEDTGFSRGRGQVTSKHRNLGGYQCSFVDPTAVRSELQALVDLIADIMDWEPFSVPKGMTATRGQRTSNASYSAILDEYPGIDEFLAEEAVFSYAVPNRNTLNYTTGIDLDAV